MTTDRAASPGGAPTPAPTGTPTFTGAPAPTGKPAPSGKPTLTSKPAPTDPPAPPTPAPPTTPTDFTTALQTAARIAVLSPSSHNCQPWAVAWARSPASRAAAARLVGDAEPGGDLVPCARTPEDGSGDGTYRYLVLGLDRSRSLRSLPAHAVEMLLSCGLHWQLLLRALDAQGWTVDALRFAEGPADAEPVRGAELPGAAWPRSWAALCVARLRAVPAGTEHAEELRTLSAAARARRTNRAPYRPHPVQPALLDGLLTPSGAAAARGADVTVRHLTSGADRAAFADFVARHGGRDFRHRAAWRETHAYLRSNEIEAAARGDGFAIDRLFGPLRWPHRQVMRAALAPATMRILSHVGYHRLLASRLAHLVRPTPVVVAMSFARTEPTLADAVKGGARLADYWLCATGAGLVLHPVSVVLQHDDLRTALQSRLGIAGRAFFMSRLGWPATEFPVSPRRPADASLRTI
ncbi:RedV protein [Streptomyces aureoverticillatus]|uniref:RedV protein n=1 Tax=Streptomyces aureoverticillatus TaxID=66871 RepID=UPI00195340E7|nr:RedV protein [Streptomyces aureoverticillatus]